MTNEEALDFLENGDWFQAVYNNLPESTANEVAEAINTVGNAIRAAKKCDQMQPSFISDHSGGVNKMVDHVADVGNMAPLTLEQLRQMDGKPVWLEDKQMPELSGWGIMRDDVCDGYHGVCFIEEYGKRWIAYAYPPANIDLEAWEPCDVCEEYKAILFGGYRTFKDAAGPCRSSKPHISGGARFCPRCGRPLMPGAWAELEKRLRGCVE